MRLVDVAPPSVAQFRFYEELNDFLAPALRKCEFAYAFTGTPSVKDAFEAIGVPHTEVDLVLVDGESVDFTKRLAGGERVAVYPNPTSKRRTPYPRGACVSIAGRSWACCPAYSRENPAPSCGKCR